MTCIAALEAEDARLQAQVEEAEASCDECVEPKSPGFFRCYFCDKRFCGPHGAPHFKRTENIEVERDGYKALAERRGELGEALARSQDWILAGFPDGEDYKKADRAIKAWIEGAALAAPPEEAEKE